MTEKDFRNGLLVWAYLVNMALPQIVCCWFRAKVVINLVLSQANTCNYCLAAHAALGKMSGFADEQMLDNPPG